MTDIAQPHQSLTQWLGGQPNWLQHAASDLLAGRAMDTAGYTRYAALAKAEAAASPEPLDAPLNIAGLENAAGESVSLVSIADVSGIGCPTRRANCRL